MSWPMSATCWSPAYILCCRLISHSRVKYQRTPEIGTLTTNRITNELFYTPCLSFSYIAGAYQADGLKQQHRARGIGDRPMLHAAWHHNNLALAHIYGAIAELHGEGSLEDEKQFIGIRVRMPVEGAGELGDFDILPIQAGDDPRRPVVVEARELVVEVNAFHPLTIRVLGRLDNTPAGVERGISRRTLFY